MRTRKYIRGIKMSDEQLENRRKRRPVKVKRRKRRVQNRRRMEEPDRDLIRGFGRKLISMCIALVLILIIGGVAFGGRIKKAMSSGEKLGFHTVMEVLYPEKYSYSTEPADMNEYFSLFSDDDVAIVLQDERIETRAKLIGGDVYFSSDTVYDLFTKRFYYNETEGRLLYTTADDIYSVKVGDESNYYETSEGRKDFDKPIARLYKDGTLYIAADYVRMFSNFSYELFKDPNRLKLVTEWGTDRMATVKDDTYVRVKGGVKSDVLCHSQAGDKVEVLETMETWTKVKTADCFIGYVENDRLSEYTEENPTPVTDAYDPRADFDAHRIDAGQIFLGFHQIGAPDDGTQLTQLLDNAVSVNTVSPTWFYLQDADGTYLDLSNANYVKTAHNRDVKVWPLLEDMTNDVDEYALFSSSKARRNLIDGLIASVSACGADGINIDLERIDSKTGPHYVQFLRELSIETHKRDLVLSVDDFAPNEGNIYYNYNEQGHVADYLALMQYNEHWGSSEAGSVASVGFIEEGLQKTLDRGVPSERIISILPFYTRIWRIEGAETTSDAVAMDTAVQFLVNHGITPGWDDELCQNYAEFEDGTATYKVWLEDEQSMRAKLGVLSEKGVKNAGGWRLGLENGGTWGWFVEILE